MIVRVYMVEPETGSAKCLELGPDLGFELVSDPRPEKEPDPGTNQVFGEIPIFIDQVRNSLRRQHGAAFDQDKVQAHPQGRVPLRAIDCISGGFG